MIARRWQGPILVGLCAALLLGATITRQALVAGQTALIGGTASRVVVTNSAGNLTTSVILQDDGVDARLLTGTLRLEDGSFTAPSLRRNTDARGLFFDPVPSIGGGTGFRVYGDATNISVILGQGGSLVNAVQIGSTGQYVWTSNASAGLGVVDSGIERVSSGVTGINNGTAGTRADLQLRNFHATGWVHVQSGFSLSTHVVTVANDTSALTANAEVLAGGGRGAYFIDCNDPQGCVIQLGTAVTPGTVAQIFNVSSNANVLSVGNVTGVQHVQSLFTMSTNHVIAFMYTTNRSGASIWIETGRNGRAL